MFVSCASKKTLRKPIFETTTYKGEKGNKEVNNLNKNRADREKEHFLALEKADEAKRLVEKEQAEMNKIDTSERVGEIELALQKIYERTQQIINELNEISPYSINGHQKTLKLATELNDLMQNYIEPLTKMIESNKEVKKIGGDISFNVGSANLNNNGKKEISKLIKSIKVDMAEWNQYLEDHNVNIFKDSIYRLMIVVNGYADAQGDGSESARKAKNLELSKLRAEAVADEIIEQVNKYNFGHEIMIDIDIKGRGEAYPPNLSEKDIKVNSAERRISRISMVVGPKILLYEN
ncbi:MAG: OmpA family protein [Crocinitomicaceae bacterium]|nr:OmpA family protein [Crocinitomicaceae bacterium]